MKINCAHDELLDIEKVVPNPKNPNKHPEKQIERLAKIIDYQGQRSPIIISKQSGFIVVGHGRFEAMKKLGWEKVAVNYQDFENETQEYAHMTADNAIAEWAELDLSQINTDFLDFGPDFNIDMLGIEDFKIDLSEHEEKKKDNEFILEVKFPNDTERTSVYNSMLEKGYIAKMKGL